jgi:hypothetical protein
MYEITDNKYDDFETLYYDQLFCYKFYLYAGHTNLHTIHYTVRDLERKETFTHQICTAFFLALKIRSWKSTVLAQNSTYKEAVT